MVLPKMREEKMKPPKFRREKKRGDWPLKNVFSPEKNPLPKNIITNKIKL